MLKFSFDSCITYPILMAIIPNRMVQSLPKTRLFLLQNILVVIQALTDSEKTLFKPFSIARAISPSIFPLLQLSHWKYATKLFEAIILVTDRLVSSSTNQIILDNFAKFQHDISNGNYQLSLTIFIG